MAKNPYLVQREGRWVVEGGEGTPQGQQAALAQARREGLNGHVRNLPDGRVEIVAEGDHEAVERFERAIRRGPAGARVERCDVSELAPSRRASGFSIRI